MRPIERGEAPSDPQGAPIVFKQYKDADVELIRRLGRYCSYCERCIPSGLAIEHIQPKSSAPLLERSWTNFLLSCPNCNSTKGATRIDENNIGDYLWPDRDNTFLAIVYEEGGVLRPNPRLPRDVQEKAQRTIKLLGLDRNPSEPNSKDYRWRDRIEVWNIAQDARQDLLTVIKSGNTETINLMRNRIVDSARCCFSIWMTVFSDDPEMLRRFIKKFPGTAENCFDKDGRPVPRPGGQI